MMRQTSSRWPVSVSGEGEGFFPITHWLFQATGRAQKLLTGETRCQLIGQSLAAIFNYHHLMTFCFKIVPFFDR